jgi:hypothetical protein
MRLRGLKPPRGFPHTDLNRARLPDFATAANGLKVAPAIRTRRVRSAPDRRKSPSLTSSRSLVDCVDQISTKSLSSQAVDKFGRLRRSDRHDPPFSTSPARQTIPCRFVWSHGPPTAGRDAGRWTPDVGPALPLFPATLDQFPPLSSRGLGRRPLTAETRVRIPVAVSTKRQQIPAKALATRSNRGPIPARAGQTKGS